VRCPAGAPPRPPAGFSYPACAHTTRPSPMLKIKIILTGPEPVLLQSQLQGPGISLNVKFNNGSSAFSLYAQIVTAKYREVALERQIKVLHTIKEYLLDRPFGDWTTAKALKIEVPLRH
jgi:hypothetical protein